MKLYEVPPKTKIRVLKAKDEDWAAEYRAMIAAAPAPAVPDEVLDSLGMHDAAVKLARRLGYTWAGGEWSAAPAVPQEPIYGKYTADDLVRGVLQSAAPAVREPQDERIRWRDAVIKEAESALRTAEQEFADMPTWANVGHAAKKVTHALAVIAALGIGGGGK